MEGRMKMNRTGMLTIEMDGYGDIVSRVYNSEDYYFKQEIMYNEYHKRIIDITRDRKGQLISSYRYEYEYDTYNNLIKKLVYFNSCHHEEKLSTYLYYNEYDENNYLTRQSETSESGKVLTITNYYYSDNMISTKVVRLTPEFLGEVSTYIWSQDKSMGEEVVCDENGNVLCNYLHELVSNNRYKITLLNPQKSKFKWRIDSIESDMSCISIYEALLDPTVLEEICQYMRNIHPDIKFLLVDIANTDADTYLGEIDKVISYYMKHYNLQIQLDM